MTPIDQWLERAYWISQSILVLIALAAAIAAYIHVRTIKLFELLKFLEEPEIRRARLTVFEDIRNKAGTEWWKSDSRLQEAASTVCASYDIVARLARGRSRRFFRRHWAYSICWTHEALDEFLRDRRREVPDAYRGYSDLYIEAKRFDPRLNPHHRHRWLFRSN
jgi:hypothetical protein